MGFIVQQLRYIIFFVFIVLRFPKPMSCQMQKRITSKTAADFSLRASGHCLCRAHNLNAIFHILKQQRRGWCKNELWEGGVVEIITCLS